MHVRLKLSEEECSHGRSNNFYLYCVAKKHFYGYVLSGYQHLGFVGKGTLGED